MCLFFAFVYFVAFIGSVATSGCVAGSFATFGSVTVSSVSWRVVLLSKFFIEKICF